jgi:hypothetical protein
MHVGTLYMYYNQWFQMVAEIRLAKGSAQLQHISTPVFLIYKLLLIRL